MSRPKGPPSQAILIWIPIQLYKDLKIERRETGKFDTLSELIGKSVEIISIGPDREQTIFCGKS